MKLSIPARFLSLLALLALAPSAIADDGVDLRVAPRVGQKWTYSYKTLPSHVMPGVPPEGISTQEFVSAYAHEGRSVLQLDISYPGRTDSYRVAYHEEYVELQSVTSAPWTWQSFPTPRAAEGRSWEVDSMIMTYTYFGDITVPAGAFQGCWKLTYNSSYDNLPEHIVHMSINCPGVGMPVHTESYVNNTGLKYSQAELRSYIP